MDPWGKLATLSKQELLQLQNKKLNHFINTYLYPLSPFYRRLFDQNKINPQKIKIIEDLKCIPLISKAEFIDQSKPDQFKDFILQPEEAKIRRYWPALRLMQLKYLALTRGKSYVQQRMEEEFRPIFITLTTGTTNRPVSFFYTKYDIHNLYISGSRMIELFGMKGSDYLVNLFPFAPHLAFWQVVFGGLSTGVLGFNTGGGKVMGTEGNIAALEKISPSVILGVPSYVYHVIRMAKEKGCRLDCIKKVVLGAAKVTEAFKVKLAGMLESMGAKGVCVFGTYGFTEARSAWAECPTTNDTSSGYHLYPDKEIFEVIDPKTQEVKMEGEDGELVYTSLDSRASSVIRFRTGDFVKGGITYRPCPYCQRTVPRISSDIIRISDVKDLQISKIKGSLVNLNLFSAIFSEFKEIEEWQIELCKKDNDPFENDQLIVNLCVKVGVDQKELAEKVKSQLLLTTEITPNQINFISLAEMVKRLELETAHKEKRIIDKRPKM